MGARHEPDSDRAGDVARHYLSDLVYGANDGLVTTFAIVSGAAGAGLPPGVALVLGMVNLAADGFSMGASNYLAIRSGALVEGNDRGVREPLLHAAATFAAFVAAGALPLVARGVPWLGGSFLASALVTAAGLFAVGAARSLVAPKPWTRTGLEMLGVGALASAVAYGAGVLVAPWAGRAV
jgi:VIT1/CCC1 family predicted Fe2+/Mn2+ transporter